MKSVNSLKVRVCPVCKKEFTSRNSAKKYFSPKSSDKMSKARKKK